MARLCLVWGGLATIGTAIGFVPSFRELNWIAIPFGATGAVLSVIVLMVTKERRKRALIVGLSLCLLAPLLAVLGLIMAGVAI